MDPTSALLNFVTIGGVPSPGRAKLTGASIPYKWDILPAYGVSGAHTVYHGRDIAKFTLTIDLWDPAHFIAWELFKKLLEPPSLFKPLVVQMGHPLLTELGITGVAIESRGALERQDDGIWRCTIQCLEFRPPLPALVTPKGIVPSASKGVPIPPKTAADIALAETVAKVEADRAAASK